MAYEVRVLENSISRITLCEAVVVLDGKEFLLRPTLRGVLTILDGGGFEKTIEGLLREDFDSIEIALRAGLNWKRKKSKKIQNLIFQNGITADLIAGLVEFLENLMRGGKLKEDPRNTPKLPNKTDDFAVTLEQWVDKQFAFATGWLGWTPETALNTTLGALNLAIDGKVDFVKKTNPFGNKEEEEDLAQQPANPEFAAMKFVEFARRKMAQQARERKKESSG